MQGVVAQRLISESPNADVIWWIFAQIILIYFFMLMSDDAKMYCHIKDIADKDRLQTGIIIIIIYTFV